MQAGSLRRNVNLSSSTKGASFGKQALFSAGM